MEGVMIPVQTRLQLGFMFDLISTFVLDLPTSTDALFWPLPLHQLAGQSTDGLWTDLRESSSPVITLGQLVEYPM